MTTSSSLRSLPVVAVSPEAFRPYGQVIRASVDGAEFGPEDAQLKLNAGTPRFYIMRLKRRGVRFDQITRHQRCTQCLGSLGGIPWMIAVAPPGSQPQPNLKQLRAFAIPGDCFIKLEIGTWHAGPYFVADQVDFYNLELSDTNITDHDTCQLAQQFGLTFELACP